MNTIDIKVDDDPVATTEKELTADAILTLAGLDPAKRYLVRLFGKNQESYKDRGTELIKVHPNQEFLSVGYGPAPLS